MKKLLFLSLVMVLMPGLILAQDERERRGDDGGNGEHHEKQGHRNFRPTRQRPARSRAVRHQAVSPQFRSMGVRSFPKPIARNRLMAVGREHSSIAFPNRGPNGVSIHANVIARTNFSSNVLVRNHMTVINAPAFRANIVNYCGRETVVNHYYWHTYNGFNFCHYYDPWGYHWYGWYLGNAYFWTRWYNSHYWWYDPAYYRWCYWHDGAWWWQAPNTTTIYVYNNGNYVSSNAPAGASAAPPASNVKSADYFNGDSSREVRVVEGGDAFLYDISGDNAFKPIFLGSNVTDVKFSNPKNGGSSQILLMLKDGSFSTFDADGNPIGGSGNSGAMSGPAPGDDQGQDAQVPANGPNPGTAPQPPPSGANPPSNPPDQGN